MLILSRRVGETLRIGSNITVTIVGVKGNYIRIGISAPVNVAVHREELYERIRRGTAQLRVNHVSGVRRPLKPSPAAPGDSRSGSVRGRTHGTPRGAFEG